MTRSVVIQAIRHTIRRPPSRGLWPGQTRCGIDFHYNRGQSAHALTNFANSRHGSATNKGATCLDCLIFDDLLEG